MNIFRKIIKYLWFFRERMPFLNFPLPCFLPYGNPFLAYGDEIGLKIFFHIPFEEREWRFVSNFLKPGMTFFDVGANQGFYSILAAKNVGAQGKVFSFEPQPGEIKKIKNNIKINNFNNITIEPSALSSQEGFSKMYICLDGMGSFSSLRLPVGGARKKIIEVPIITLDSYINKFNISSVNFIKIDVEGGELEAMKGAKFFFKKLRPVLMCELTEERANQWNYSTVEIYKFLESYDYLFFETADGGLLKPLKTSENYNLNIGNLVAAPKEKIAQIADLIKTDKE